MAATKTRDRRYWDACNFIGVINKEPDKVGVCSAILKEAQSANPRIQIVTSIFTIAEVVKPKGCVGLTPEDEQQIDDFFENEWIVPVNADRSLMEEARRLQRLHGLKVHDAIHVASAIAAEVGIIETYDTNLLKWNNVIANPHGVDPIQIRKPIYQYPRQGELGENA